MSGPAKSGSPGALGVIRRLRRGLSGRVDEVLMTVFLAFVAVVVLWTMVFEDGDSRPAPAQVPSRELPSMHPW